MRYSLLSQFQGSLLGVSLGLLWHNLTDCSATAAGISHPSQLSTQFNQPNQPEESLLTQGKVNQLSSIFLLNNSLDLILSWVDSLIHQPGMECEDWHKIWQSHQNLTLNNGHGSGSSQQMGCPVEIAALPMMLFFHENRCRLREQLQQVAQLCQPEPLNNTLSSDSTPIGLGLLALGEAIAYLLRPSQDLQQLIPHILTQIPQETTLAQQLTQVSILIQAGASLDTAVHHLIPNPTPTSELTSNLAIAIYCFLTTPTAFSVSVGRAMRTSQQQPLTCGITGALSGAYNGLPSLPIPSKLKLRTLTQSTLDSSSNPALGGRVPFDQQILKQATQLFQVWAGLYSPTDPDQNHLSSLIVAAPFVCQTNR